MRFMRLGMLTIVLVVLASALYGQEVVVPLLPYDGNASTFVNSQIRADTTANGGLSANRVYELQRGQYYFVNATFTVPNGKTLRLRAAAGAGGAFGGAQHGVEGARRGAGEIRGAGGRCRKTEG